jgi:hypothetical protein
VDNCQKAAVAHLPTASTTTATIQKRIFKNRRMLYLMKGHFRVLTNPSTLVVEFSNGDKVEASFDTKTRVKEFLEFVTNQ